VAARTALSASGIGQAINLAGIGHLHGRGAGVSGRRRSAQTQALGGDGPPPCQSRCPEHQGAGKDAWRAWAWARGLRRLVPVPDGLLEVLATHSAAHGPPC